MSSEPPPLYTQDACQSFQSSDEDGVTDPEDPQILIIPPSQSAQFQKGYLGAEDERAAIEGELQIKGIRASACRKVYVFLHFRSSTTNSSVKNRMSADC
jgi:neural Wiskott-Aldrich syndrome protein